MQMNPAFVYIPHHSLQKTENQYLYTSTAGFEQMIFSLPLVFETAKTDMVLGCVCVLLLRYTQRKAKGT